MQHNKLHIKTFFLSSFPQDFLEHLSTFVCLCTCVSTLVCNIWGPAQIWGGLLGCDLGLRSLLFWTKRLVCLEEDGKMLASARTSKCMFVQASSF